MTCKCNPRKHGEMYMPAKKAVCCIYCREPIEGQVQCKCGKIVIPGEVHHCPCETSPDGQHHFDAGQAMIICMYCGANRQYFVSYNKGKD